MPYISSTPIREQETFGKRFIFEYFFGQGFVQSCGFRQIKLQIISTYPSGMLKIIDLTQMELLLEGLK
jgi:transitional endoplasmic reticulum ATPase